LYPVQVYASLISHSLAFYFLSISVNEVWRGRESFSDTKARMEAIESLKKMLRSWLDDTFPEMSEAKRVALAEAMDITLVEKVKEQSMRTFFEINNVVRMSFIEMQYMKKVRQIFILLSLDIKAGSYSLPSVTRK